MLTELEGAILIEIGCRDRHTAFKVRQAFRESPSSDWQGSAGSVYPAIRRLIERGFLETAATTDGRGTQHLTLSTAGREALLAWSTNVETTVSIGMDPFRLRAGLWDTMNRDEQLSHADALLVAAKQTISDLRHYKQDQDKFETVQIELAIELQQLRVRWIKNWQSRIGAGL